MAQTKTTEVIHPLGEGDFSFSTPGGRVRLSVTKDALTPFGGLVPWAAYIKHIGMAHSRMSSKISSERKHHV